MKYSVPPHALYRQNYTPTIVPTEDGWTLADVVLMFLAGCALGLVIGLIATGN